MLEYRSDTRSMVKIGRYSRVTHAETGVTNVTWRRQPASFHEIDVFQA
jgi:hypothetical protein